MTEQTARLFLDTPVRKLDTRTARIAYRHFGSGPALLLVHGFPLSGFTWRKVLPELSKHYTCFVPDVPGLGESEWTDETDFSFPGQGRTLKAFVDRLGLERYSLLAQDTGGTFARCLALEDAKRVEKIALLNTEMPYHRPPWIPLYQFLMRSRVTPYFFKLLLGSRAFVRSSMGFGGCFNDLSLLEGDFDAHVIQPLRWSARRREGLRRFLRGAKWAPVDALAREHSHLRAPVRLIWGADDRTFPIELARAMLKQFPDAHLVPVEGARLLVHEEKPEEVAGAALDFLA